MGLPADSSLHVRFNADEYEWLGRVAARLRAPRSAVVRAVIKDFQRRSEKAGKVLLDLGEIEVEIA